jgi:hypothetical protein
MNYINNDTAPLHLQSCFLVSRQGAVDMVQTMGETL